MAEAAGETVITRLQDIPLDRQSVELPVSRLAPPRALRMAPSFCIPTIRQHSNLVFKWCVCVCVCDAGPTRCALLSSDQGWPASGIHLRGCPHSP